MLKVINGWNDSEVDYVVKNYNTMTYSEIAKNLNKSVESVSYVIRKNNLVKQQHSSWTDDDLEYLKTNYELMSSAEISKKINRSINSVNSMIHKLGLKKHSKWSKEEVDFLKDNYNKMSYEELGLVLQKTTGAINAKCFDLGLQKKEKPWENWEYEYLKNNYMELPVAEIAQTLGRSVSGVRLKASRNGLKKSPYSCNYHYFSNIDSEEKAYWLGFLMADGWLSYNANLNSGCIGVELQYKDLDHLKKFNKCLNGNYKITDRYRICNFNNKRVHSCQIRIYSLTMYNDLIGLGFTSDKSFNAKIPPIRSDLIRHFVRGYFDGNGSISIKEIYGSCYIKFTTASKQFVDDLFFEMANNNIEISEYESVSEYGTTIYNPYISGSEKNRLTFLEYIYKDATIFLDRKYKKYLRINNKNNAERKPRQSEMTGSI